MKIVVHHNDKIKLSGLPVSGDKLLEGIPDGLPREPSMRMLIIGAPGSGKTSLMVSLLQKYYKKKFDRIYLISGSKQTLPEKFLTKLDESRVYDTLTIETIDGIIEQIRGNGLKNLIILDDVVKEMADANIQRRLMQIFYNARHIASNGEGGSLAIWTVAQRLYGIPPQLRPAASYVIFFNLGSRKETEILYDQFVTFLDRLEFRQLIQYLQKNNRGHDFLFIDVARGSLARTFDPIELIDDQSLEVQDQITK